MNKEEIIISYDKGEFRDFVENDYDGKILELLDEEGLKILANYRYKENRICYILTYSKYKDELFQNEAFLDLFFQTDLSDYYATLRNLRFETYDIMLEKYRTLNPSDENFARLFSYFGREYKMKKLENWPYGIDILYSLINKEQAEEISYIINNYPIDLSDRRLTIEGIATFAKESVLRAYKMKNANNKIIPAIEIPPQMVNKKLAKSLISRFNIFEIRMIINDLEWCTNPEDANNYIKRLEDNTINSFEENQLVSSFQELFNLYKEMKEADEKDDNSYYELHHKLMEMTDTRLFRKIYTEINLKYRVGGIKAVYDYLQELSNRELSNYIIDYHFEDIYYNVMLDLRELLKFYYDGNIVLPEDRVELYTNILNIDYLSIEEKKNLHRRLRDINIKEMFYDDMKMARYVVSEAIKESSLSRETIGKYKDEKLSLEYGVDVYVMNDEPFFGIVKSGSHANDFFPTGHSYSLVGHDCVTTFGDPKESETFVYDSKDLNPEQMVHVFPFDSYTLYKPFEVVPKPSRRGYPLMMPYEITGLSGLNYSELLIFEKGNKKTDLDERIPELKRIALYCMDEIRSKDVQVAKAAGVGIVLVNSKKYFENHEYYKDKYDYIYELFGDKYNYFDYGEAEKMEARR